MPVLLIAAAAVGHCLGNLVTRCCYLPEGALLVLCSMWFAAMRTAALRWHCILWWSVVGMGAASGAMPMGDSCHRFVPAVSILCLAWAPTSCL